MTATAPTRKALTHDRIVQTAAGVLREDGFDGVGVADIMQRTGLTHGGFYAHFPSREALLAQALDRAGQDSGVRLRTSIAAGEARGLSPFRALVESYLSERHLNAPQSGCPVAALASELARQPPAVRAAGSQRVKALIATVRSCLPKGNAPHAAALVAGQLAGALQLARASGDAAWARRHLAATRQFLLETFEPASCE